jgi:DNA repair protein RadA/Sms
MSKTRTAFFCQNCGYESAKWAGRCPSCEQWNTFVEEVTEAAGSTTDRWKTATRGQTRTVSLAEVESGPQVRMLTRDAELNRVLGGGIVPGSLMLVAGEPGIGKSTLFLQQALQMKGLPTLYVSGEESPEQIRMRADRLGMHSDDFYLLTETDTAIIFDEIGKLNPGLVIVDSIQTLQSPSVDSTPGSISQIRTCTAELQRFAKATRTPVFIIGHITKEGNIAGPKVLEHMVDTVLQFEGDQHYLYRILRTVKNRFGSTSELGIYEMTEKGLRQVSNPSEILISDNGESLSGIAIAASMEGARPLLIETQALVTHSVYGTPQRTVNGFDLRRLQLLLAVLEKRGGFQFGVKDVFLNIAGGLRVEDPSTDLAVISALLSSYNDVPIPHHYCFAGEVGLSGEIRPVNRIEQRIAEADKLGFEKIFISRINKKGLDLSRYKLEVVMSARIEELYARLF